MAETTVYLKDYQPFPFALLSVSLNFDLYDDHAIVKNNMQFKRTQTGEFRLYGDDLELLTIHLNSEPLTQEDYYFDANDLIIKSCPEAFTLTLVTRIQPQNNTQLSGLYRSNGMFCTQCEAEGFRRITYFPDRPDVLTTYTTRMSAEKAKYPILLSNGNLHDQGDTEDGRHWAVWHDPFKKPSYLFALVAGQLAEIRDTFTTCSGRTVALHIYVEPGNEDKCAHAMESLKRSMRWDEEQFGREYDLDIFMIVAVSDFNMGAMENKGLNIFNSKYILARPDTATDEDYAAIEGVIGHEYFHNWSGNRVTCRDWFQLSLKEGLTVFRDQEFSADMNSRDVVRINEIKKLRAAQFPEDAGQMAHPVRPTSYQEINNFYTATIYNKGAEVIRMQQTLLGKAGFRRGMDLYFERHDGQAVTIDDFVCAMEEANHVDLTQFKRWYSQAGTPRVTARSEYINGRLALHLTQHCPPTPESKNKEPFHIPIKIALFSSEGHELPLENSVIELREAEQTFYFDNLKEKPLVSMLREFSAPIILQRDLNEEELLSLLQYETDGFAKWDAAQSLAKACLVACYNSFDNNWQISQALLNAYQHVLRDETLDPALRAEILLPPSHEEFIAELTCADVSRVVEIRDFFRMQLGAFLFNDAKALYEKLLQKGDQRMQGSAFGKRKLRNVCLGLMMKGRESDALEFCQRQFTESSLMTDQIASFALLVNSQDEMIRQNAIDVFYQQWQTEDLVLDKWFIIQATAEASNTLERVKNLLNHPAFTLKNPNKVRSLLGAFTQSNPRHFHAIDGSGYLFLTEMLLILDKLNPQISARLATPFTRWQSLDKNRQTLIREQLNRLSQLDLSKDLSEVVNKSL